MLYNKMPICQSVSECSQIFPLNSHIFIDNQQYKIVGYFYDYDGIYFWWPELESQTKSNIIFLLQNHNFEVII